MIIVGGGLAGIAAAIRLLGTECTPVLIESRKRLGGRATSYAEPRSGEIIDNCQHVLMGCCTNLIDLYHRLDVIEHIDWRRTLYWTHRDGEIDQIGAGRLPAPLHLARAFSRLSFLDRTERAQVRRAMWRMLRMGRKGRFVWRQRTFAEFLEELGQGDSVIRKFWDVIVTSACNLDVKRVGAAHALQVFQEGFLADRWSYTMGVPTVPLGQLYATVAERITGDGGEVLLGASALAIAFNGDRVTGVITQAGPVDGAAVIAAVPFDRLDRLVSDTMRQADTRLHSLREFEVSPILGVHLWFDQQILEVPHLVLAGYDVQWLFNKGVDDRGRQHVHAVISAADDWMDLDEQSIVSRVMRDLHAALPNTVGLAPIQVRSIKEKRATFAATPESDRLRPSAAAGYVGSTGGGIKNLYLAGDWCDTGWPATMEGAVRSGYSAAQAVSGEGGVVEDVPAAWLSRLLGLR